MFRLWGLGFRVWALELSEGRFGLWGLGLGCIDEVPKASGYPKHSTPNTLTPLRVM